MPKNPASCRIMTDTKSNTIERPPVVVIMGHIDHGKSTLLDYIRKSNVVAGEAGGITQHLGAYEVEHADKAGVKKRITFLDTPGHEAFKGVRSRGASVADIAILIVSAEDGVMPQTIEAVNVINSAKMPFIVAINKMDAPRANVEGTKNSLIENGIYIEGYGGNIPAVAISAKTGQNVDELLDLILLSAEVEGLVANPSVPATGYIIEVNKDKRIGISATIVIKDGTLEQGQFVACENALSPIRVMDDQNGVKIKTASFSTPVHVSGWNDLPGVGLAFKTFDSKKEAEKYCASCASTAKKVFTLKNIESADHFIVPVIIKADTQGSIEAIEYELSKIKLLNAELKIVYSGTGNIGEKDAKIAATNENTLIVGFGIEIDPQAETIKERTGLSINVFNIIYELTDWVKNTAEAMRPRVEVEERKGIFKVLKIFNASKHNQVLGGKVKEGLIEVGNKIKILRRGEEIGRGVIKGLQHMKTEVTSVVEGAEFGTSIDAKIEMAPGDEIEAFEIVKK